MCDAADFTAAELAAMDNVSEIPLRGGGWLGVGARGVGF